MTRRARGLRFAFAAAVLLPHGAARANGRYPVANQLVVAPGDSSYLVLRSTFGILQSSDGGKSWSWICEQAAGYNDDDEPAVAVTADGSIVVGSEGLTASHNRGCSWSMPDEFGVSTIVTDLDVDRSAPHHLVALSGKGDGMVGYTNRVLESLDDGRTWVPLGNAIANGLIAETIEIAPSGRVYLSGIHPPSGFLVRSGDAGATWTELPIAGPDGSIPFIAAVDTSNSDRIYVRSKAGDSDRLFVTSNSGESWTEIFSLPGSILGFALSPDGRRVAVGGPALGISVAGTTDYVFRRVSMVGAYCLRWTEAGLYACAKEAVDGFTVGLSGDEGAHFASVLHVADLLPLQCARETQTGSACPSFWNPIAARIGADPGGVPTTRVDSGQNTASAGNQSGNDCSLAWSSSAKPNAVYWVIAIAVGLARRTRLDATLLVAIVLRGHG